ncbi:hypothetical protein G4228_018960 [Cervus hanglu yarkandensis]|nr:hypothetical protein G4228_018960 [Cervus hanglu yarkandensis]
MAYGAKRYNYLKPRAEEERRLAAEEKKKQDEQKRIERELAEAQEDYHIEVSLPFSGAVWMNKVFCAL